MNPLANKHPFDRAVNLTWDSGIFQGKTSPDYANMIGPFGGIIAATMLQAVMKHPDVLGEPVSLTVNYAAPISEEPFTIKSVATKTNRNTQFWSIELQQDEHIKITGSAVFAKRRNTWSAMDTTGLDVPAVDNVPSIPTDGLPAWINNYDIKVIEGVPQFFTADKSDHPKETATIQWIRDKPRRPLDFLSLAALCDAFFPRIFIRRNKIVPTGTVSLTIYFHADSDNLTKYGDKFVLGHAKAKKYYNGFFDQTADIWTDDGELLATSNQMVYYRK